MIETRCPGTPPNPALGIFRMDVLESIIQQATNGRINRADAESFCAVEGIEMTNLYNQVALTIAKRFHSGTLSYEDGDGGLTNGWTGAAV